MPRKTKPIAPISGSQTANPLSDREKLIHALQAENERNYSSYKGEKEIPRVTIEVERTLARIEYAIFDTANIQRDEFAKLCEKYPQWKDGLKCYK